MRGFGVQLTKSSKTYIIQSRVKGVTRRVSLGRHGVLTLQEARKKATKELSKMLDGKDPVIEKKREETFALTLREITQNYLNHRRDLKALSRRDILKHLNHAFSVWADKPAFEITSDKVDVRFRELTDKAPTQANQALRVLRAIFNYARAKYKPNGKTIFLENPVSILSDAKLWNKTHARSGRIPTGKIGIAWNFLQNLRQSPGETVVTHTIADALSFLLLTGARWSEMATLTWDKVNLDESWWHIEDPKNRNPVTFPLSWSAVEILKNRPETPFIFPSRTGNGHLGDARGILEKLSNAVGKITAHDLRRTFRAIAGECQIELWKTKLLMGHRIGVDVTITHYTETNDLRYLKKEIDTIADWVNRQGTIARSDNVVPFPIKKGA